MTFPDPAPHLGFSSLCLKDSSPHVCSPFSQSPPSPGPDVVSVLPALSLGNQFINNWYLPETHGTS